MNPDQLPTVSTFRVEKPGKSKFAPSIGGRKPKETEPATTSNTSASVISNTPVEPVTVTTTGTDLVEEQPVITTSSNTTATTTATTTSTTTAHPQSPLNKSTTTVGKKIESIQSRRSTTAVTNTNNSTQSSLASSSDQSIKMPSGPKDAASIATSINTTGSVPSEKRTMAYFLKDSGEGREMPTASNSGGSNQNTGSDPSLSPSKTRRIVNLRNIKAPPRSATTSTALAPQVRVVDGAIVYDEKFSAAISMPVTSDLEQELEYVDEDDEHGKHLTSATYSTRAKGSNRWNIAETDLFYEALSMCGTDFSMIQTLFPHRSRAQIKGKYKLEEKSNPQRISAALKNKKTFDPNFKDRVNEIKPTKK